MAVRKIIRMGHPNLRVPALAIPTSAIGTPELNRLIADMMDTLDDYAGIGLAAPQIDEPLRLAIIQIHGGATRYGDIEPLPMTVFINPKVDLLDGETAGYWEGCLSVPGLRGFVERPQHVQISYTDMDGNLQQIELNGFLATVFQHEFDHLDGKLYVDHITDSSKLVFEEEFARYWSDDD